MILLGAAEFAPIAVALVNGLAPLIISILIMFPLWLAPLYSSPEGLASSLGLKKISNTAS